MSLKCPYSAFRVEELYVVKTIITLNLQPSARGEDQTDPLSKVEDPRSPLPKVDGEGSFSEVDGEGAFRVRGRFRVLGWLAPTRGQTPNLCRLLRSVHPD